jgi:hypothetical protein
MTRADKYPADARQVLRVQAWLGGARKCDLPLTSVGWWT